jgi:hypothetical protein
MADEEKNIGKLINTPMKDLGPDDKQKMIKLAVAVGLILLVAAAIFFGGRLLGGDRSATRPTQAKPVGPNTDDTFKTVVSDGVQNYGISCKTICDSHNYKMLGRASGGYENPVCFCGDIETGAIWSFVMV